MNYNGKTVQIMAMSECPNECKHCFVGYKGHIPFDELDKMLENYTKKYEKVILNGTELLMDERYLLLCQKYGQNFIYSNGKMLTPDARKRLKKYNINRVSISLHYGLQDEISNIHVEDLSRLVVDMVKEGFEVRILCNISKDNYMKVPEIVEYVHGLGARGIKFINLIKEGKGSNYEEKLLSSSEIESFLDILNATREKYSQDAFYISRNGGFGNDKKRDNNFNCPAGYDWVTLLPDHSVHPCNGLLYEEFKIGELDIDGIYINREFSHDCKQCTVLNLQIEK